MTTAPKPTYRRLESLDILRGFDLFCLTMFQPLLWGWVKVFNHPWLRHLADAQFRHVEWEGFAFWDLIMPLFMFMAGVSMPFAFGGYFKGVVSARQMYRRIAKRLVWLFVLGAVSQGNLLRLDLHQLRIYDNTLQAIGVGYVCTALIIMNIRNLKAQIGISVGLLLTFWALFTFGGDHTPDGNVAEVVDKALLGRFRDGVTWNEAGQWNFSPHYHYTWILSSLNFTVTVMTGYFAGTILKSTASWQKKVEWLVWAGLGMCLVGWGWSFQHPIIKKVWSSSMTLLSSGYCFFLMALFYYLVDVKGFRKELKWLKPLGMNSILVYMFEQVIHLSEIPATLLQGFAQWTGHAQPLLVQAGEMGLVYALFYYLYRQKLFFKV